jgi:hypothetical protein
MTSDDRVNLSRRHLILSVLSGLAAVATLQGCGSPFSSSQMTSRLSQTIGDQVAAKRFGVSYLRDNPEEAGIEQLVERIDTGLLAEFGQGMNIDDPQLLAKHMDQLVRNEYRRCEAIRVDGWILSRSEARLYALVALL